MYFRFASALLLLCFLGIAGFALSERTATRDEQTARVASTTSPNLTATTSAPKPKSPAAKPKPKPVAQKPIATSAPAVHTSATTTTPQPTVSIQNDFASQVESHVHTLINAERVKNGLSTLTFNTELAALARSHSADMLNNNYFSHDDLQGCGISCRFSSINYSYWSIGENIYTMTGYTLSPQATAEKIVSGWMNSPGHRANIHNTTYTTEGVGISIRGDTIYATEDFAKPR